MNTNFPDQKFLADLSQHIKTKAEANQSPLEQLITACSISMNWIADYISDPNVSWTLEEIPLDKIYLTGTQPDWNKIIIDQCERSPKKFNELLQSNPKIKELFKEAKFEDRPILIRYEDEQYKMLDGMHRTLGAIIEGRETIEAFVARLNGKPQPQIEPHIIYDFFRAYHRGSNTDKDSLISAIKFLRRAYSNVDDLLKNRFSKNWVPDDKIQEIIQEILKD